MGQTPMFRLWPLRCAANYLGKTPSDETPEIYIGRIWCGNSVLKRSSYSLYNDFLLTVAFVFPLGWGNILEVLWVTIRAILNLKWAVIRGTFSRVIEYKRTITACPKSLGVDSFIWKIYFCGDISSRSKLRKPLCCVDSMNRFSKSWYVKS